MSVYEKNMSIIKKERPELYDAIVRKDYKMDEPSCYIETARNGMPVLCMEREGKTICLNSHYDPEREAERYVKKYEHVYDHSVMFFFGLGNGFAAKKLMEEKGDHVNFLFYEPSPDLFLLVIRHFDLTDLFTCERFALVVCGLNDENLDGVILARVNVENYRICLYNILPPYEKMYEKETKEIAHRFYYAVSLMGQNVGTSRSFEKLLTYNNILNMKKVFHCNCEEQFNGEFPIDRPAIVVGAGPSLEKNIEYLKRAKGKMLILAVDSVLPYLCEKGIHPDLAFTVDARKPVKLFEIDEVRRIPLAIITYANHDIVKMIEDKVVFISTDCDYYSKMFRLAGRDLFALPSGGNVATMAFCIAIAWGYRKIVLVGQDLALAPDKMHVGEVDEDLGITEIDEEVVQVEGYYGDQVNSLPDYNSYREWYEFVIRNDEKLEVINATEGGAKIEGTKQVPLKDVIEAYDVEPFDFERTIREMPAIFNEDQKMEVVRMWKDSLHNLDMLKTKLYDAMRLLKNGVDSIKSKQYKMSELARIRKRVDEIIKECDGMSEMFFLSDIVSGEQADVLGDIYVTKEDDTEEICRLFEKMHVYMKAMHASVDEVKELFRRNIDEVTREIKDEGGII